MKKLFLNTTLFLISLTGFSQSYNGLVPYNSVSSGASEGIIADCNISIIGTTTQNGVYFENNLHSLNIKTLRIGQKDISASQIPSQVKNGINSSANIQVSFDLYVNNVFVDRYGQPSVSWARLQGLPNSDGYKPATKENGYKLFNSGALSIRNVKIKNLTYRVDDEYYTQIRNQIAGVNNKNTTENPVKDGNSTSLTIENASSNNNPATQTGTTNTGMPANTSGNDPLAHFETDSKTVSNPMSSNTNSGSSAVDDFNRGYARGQQIADVATGIVDLFAPTPAQLQRREAKEAQEARGLALQREYDSNAAKEKKDKFIKDYMLPLMDIAENAKGTLNVSTNTMQYSKEVGNARMTLYYASYHLNMMELVPKREEWFESAVENNDFDAMLEKASQINITSENNEGFPYIVKAANLGSVDAMVRMGIYYDISNEYIKGDQKLALEYFTKAAEKGSPNAMYYLGMIYKYGSATEMKKYHVKYDVVKDEKTAFEWFTKSLQPGYKESLFAKSDANSSTFRMTYYQRYSFFEVKSYKELAIIYRQGNVVSKDKEKAKEYEKLYGEYVRESAF